MIKILTSSIDYTIFYALVNKVNIYSQRLRNYKENFYNYIIMQVLKQSSSIKNAKLRFDRRGEKALRDQLRAYLSRQLDNRNKTVFKDLKFVDSRQNTLIQLADMVAGSIFSAYTGKDKMYLVPLQVYFYVNFVYNVL